MFRNLISPNISRRYVNTFVQGVATACAVLSLGALSARADDLGVAQTFNNFVFGDFVNQSIDSQGRMAIGGNMTVPSYAIGQEEWRRAGSPATSANLNALYVSGKLTMTSGSIYGNAFAGSYSGPPAAQLFPSPPNGSLTLGNVPINAAASKASYQTRSSFYAGLTTNGSTSVSFGAMTFTGNNASSLNIFSVQASAITSSITSFNFANIAAGSTNIINVIGTETPTFAGQMNWGTTQNRPGVDKLTLFNFATTTSIVASNLRFQGSILAPNATISGAGSMDGTMIVNAANFTQGFESHIIDEGQTYNNNPGSVVLFAGNLPAVTVVPEAGSAQLLLSLLVPAFGVAIVRVRKQRRGNG